MSENVLPPLPSGEEMERQAEEERYDEVRQCLLDARENYPEPYYMLEFNGTPFSTIGGIQAISGQKKNGKTFVLAQLMAAILCDGEGKSKEYLAGLRVPQRTISWLGHEPTVLYIDTEMEKLNTAKVLRRVHWLCGWPMDVPNPRFNVLWLRSITDVKNDEGKVVEKAHERRKRLIRLAVEMFRPDALFIDGIRDIIGDFNDNEESSSLVTELMALAEENRMCIWNALHMNPRPSNDDESKMRGHLGTELGNKITDTLVSYKKKDAMGNVTFTVKQNDARGKDLEDWMFTVTDAAGSLGIPRIQNNMAAAEDSELREIDLYFGRYAWTPSGATYTDLEKYFRTKGFTSNRKIKRFFDRGLESGIIYKSEKKKYHYAGLKGNTVNDEQQNIFKMRDDDDKPF